MDAREWKKERTECVSYCDKLAMKIIQNNVAKRGRNEDVSGGGELTEGKVRTPTQVLEGPVSASKYSL